MMKRAVGLILLIISFNLLVACSTVTEPSLLYPGESPVQIFEKGKDALIDKSFGEAIKRFEALDVQYPFNKETEWAQLYLVYAYYMKEDYALSQASADRFVRLRPANPYVDYVYYIKGLAGFYQNMGVLEQIFAVDLAKRDLTQMKKAFADFQIVTIRFPKSRYAPAARQYLVYLRNMFANHELQVANYYYGRHAYVAAVNRANAVVAHYQGAPAVKEALLLMIKCYDALNMQDLKRDVEKVYRYNFTSIGS
jgi:outer membrane protein assembly factor BamD